MTSESLLAAIGSGDTKKHNYPANRAPYSKPHRPKKKRKYLVKWAQPTVHDAWWFLTPREKSFVNNVVAGMEHKAAFLAAGYIGQNGSSHLMRKPVIQAALYQKTTEAYTKAGIGEGEYLRQIATMAFMPASMLAGPPTWDHKIKALDMLGRYQKWLETNINVRASGSIAHLFGAATQATMQEAIRATRTIENALEHQPSDPLVENLAGAVLEHAPAEGES